MIRFERELGAVLLLLAEPEKVLDERAAARALLPLAARAPREFRRLGHFAQRFTRLEQGTYVHTVVYRRRRHGESPYWGAIGSRDHSPASRPVSKLARPYTFAHGRA